MKAAKIKAGNIAQRNNEKPQKIVGKVGDSTFFHSGIAGLMDIVL